MKVANLSEIATGMGASSVATVSGNIGPTVSRNMYNADGTMKNGVDYDNLLGGSKKKNKTTKEASAEKRKKKVSEGLADLAHRAEQDHEVQMARSELYKIAKYAIKLHDMLKGVSEEQGLEGWVQSKITKSADYIGSVYHHLDYDTTFGESKNFKEAAKKKYKKGSYKENLKTKLNGKLNNINEGSEEEVTTDSPEYKGWLTVYQMSPEAAETHPKHEQFLKLHQGVDEAKNADGKEQGADGKACWPGYRYAGTENGQDKCVPTGRGK